MTALSGASIRATLAVKDRDRAKQFYAGTLGLTLENDGPEVATFRGLDGTVLDIYQSEFAGTAKNTVASFQVANLDVAVAELQTNGVAFEDYSGGAAEAVSPIVERGGVRGAGFATRKATSSGSSSSPERSRSQRATIRYRGAGGRPTTS